MDKRHRVVVRAFDTGILRTCVHTREETEYMLVSTVHLASLRLDPAGLNESAATAKGTRSEQAR